MTEELPVCPGCGRRVIPTKFCIVCGHKLREASK